MNGRTIKNNPLSANAPKAKRYQRVFRLFQQGIATAKRAGQ
jgi:hypothetical protein